MLLHGITFASNNPLFTKLSVMKKIIIACSMFFALAFSNTANAQAWGKETKLLGIGVGPAY
jgi:hypothetical protein